MAISDKLQSILDSKAAIKQALINKGYSSEEVGDIFSQYSYLIENIPSSGGSGEIESALANSKCDYVKQNLLDMIAESYEITKDWVDYSLTEGSNIWFVPLLDAELEQYFAFQNCKKLLFVPKEIKSKNGSTQFFKNCYRLLFIDIPDDIIASGKAVNGMFANCSSLLYCKNVKIYNRIHTYFLQNCSNLKEVYGECIEGGKYGTMFDGCSSLTHIHGIVFDFTNCKSNSDVNNMFNKCTALEEVRFKENTLSVNYNISACTSLSHDSLLSLINACAEVSSTQSLTLGSANLAKLSEEEKTIATNKGWTLA